MDIIAPDTLANQLKLVSDTWTTVAAADTIAVPGFQKIQRVIVSFEDDPGDANLLVSAAPGATAGTIVIKTWKTDGSDPTPAAATSFGKKVAYIAVGY